MLASLALWSIRANSSALYRVATTCVELRVSLPLRLFGTIAAPAGKATLLTTLRVFLNVPRLAFWIAFAASTFGKVAGKAPNQVRRSAKLNPSIWFPKLN